MKINLEDIRKDKDISIQLNEDIGPLDINDVSFAKPVCGKIEISLVFDEILIKGDIEAEINFVCSRCLSPYLYKVSVKVNLKYSISEIKENYLDLGDELRQCCILSLPMKPLCKDTCKGLCSHCGSNRNLEDCKCKKGPLSNQWAKIKNLYRK